MAEGVSQEFFEAQVVLKEWQRNVEILIDRLWGEVETRCNRECYVLLRSKLEEGGPVSRLELADQILEELCTIWDLEIEDNSKDKKELEEEIHALKVDNANLKKRLILTSAWAEELDDQNRTLGGPGIGIQGKLEDAEKRILDLQQEVKQKDKELRKNILKKNIGTNKTETKMTDYEKLYKRVQMVVPEFWGKPSESLYAEVHKFVDGIVLAKAGLENTDLNKLIGIVKQRMFGDAYELVRLESFATIEDLIDLVKNTYLKIRSLDSVTREIADASQRADEDLRQYARRLQKLASTADVILKQNYPDAEAIGL